jgi:hypothetical protein
MKRLVSTPCALVLSACMLAGLIAHRSASAANANPSRGAAAAFAKASPSHAAGPVARRLVVPFIDGDFDRALTEARAQHRPIFIEAWAPW